MKWLVEDPGSATVLLDEAIDHLRRLVAREKDSTSFEQELLVARFLLWQRRGEDLLNEPGFTDVGVRTSHQDQSCAAQANLVKQAIISGEIDQARSMTAGLLARGYYEPSFIRTCRLYDVCQ
jgi:hypothetical protein